MQENTVISQNKFSSCCRPVRFRYISTFYPHSKAIIVVLCFCFLFVTNARSQINSGTVIILGYSQQKIIVAADSRTNYGPGLYDDNSCKITALNQKLIFTADGRVNQGNFGTTLWDAVREARAVLSSTAKNQNAPNDLMHTTAAEWAETIKREAAQGLTDRIWQSLRNQRVIVEGHFLGLDERGNIEIVGGVVYWYLEVPSNTRRIEWMLDEPKAIENSIRFAAFGDNFLLNELIIGETGRAKLETKRLEAEVIGMSQNDADIHRAIRYAELTFQYTPQQGQDMVGGPIDVVQLGRGGALRWIQRKPQCADNQADTKATPLEAPKPIPPIN